MLCRAVVTALAISCTFSREILANGQATPRKVHRKDLICVLWLSGLQKEDLDVNMLKKLQRHNVNIDIMSNDQLRQDCLQSKSRKDNANNEVYSTVDEEEHTTAFTKFESESTTEILELISSNNLSEIIQNLMYQQTPKSVENKTVIDSKKYETSQAPEILNDNDENTNETLTNTFNVKGTDSIGVKFDENKPNLDAIFKFWQMFSTAKTTTAPIITTHRPIKRKPNKKAVKFSNEKSSLYTHMNKFLTDYFAENSRPIIQTTTISPIDLPKFFQQMEQFFALLIKNKAHTENDGLIIGYDAMHHKPQTVKKYDTALNSGYVFENNTPLRGLIIKARKDKYVETNLNKHSVRDISDMLLFNDQIKKSHMVYNETNLPLEKIYDQQYKPGISGPPLWVNNAQYLSVQPMISQTTEKKRFQIFPKDVIKEITENVKASVMKDLRQKVTSTVPSSVSNYTSHTSPTIAFVSTTDSAIVQEAVNKKFTKNRTDDTSQVLKNIAQLFEEFKILKEKAFATSTTTPGTSKLSDITKEYNKSLIVERNMPIRIMDTHKLTKPPEIPFVLSESYKVPIIVGYGSENKMPKERNNVYNNYFNPLPIKKYIGPPIIQTNSGEIPPLNIPVSKPVLLIHQNIVLTTMRSKPQKPWILNHHTKKEYSDEIKNLREKINKYRGNPSQYRQHPINDSKLKKHQAGSAHKSVADSFKNKKYSDHRKDALSILNHHSKQNYETVVSFTDNQKKKYDDEHNKNNPDSGKEYRNIYDQPTRYEDNITVGFFRNHNHRDRERFHEKLERVEDWGDDSRGNGDKENCGGNNLSLASRQQVSLNNMKSKYDDTHFKNFLKTQQKVNDMLERILATKTFPSRPRSVETT